MPLEPFSYLKRFSFTPAALGSSLRKGRHVMGMTRGLQSMQIIGFALTGADMSPAPRKIHDRRSIKPRAVATVRQAGGLANYSGADWIADHIAEN